MPPFSSRLTRMTGQRARKSYVRRYNRTGAVRIARQYALSQGRMAFGGRNRIALLNQRTGGLLGIEKKFLDTGKTQTALTAPTDCSGGEYPPSTGCTGCVSAPAQGDGPTNREGNKIVVVSCYLQGQITCAVQADQTAADLAPTVFVALVMDTQTNGQQLNSEDVYVNTAAAALQACQINRNMSYTSRFKVLKKWKKQLVMPTMSFDGTNIEQSGFTTPFTLSWKGKMPVTFTTGSTTADIANVSNNSIQVIAWCNNTTLTPGINYNCRIRFYG